MSFSQPHPVMPDVRNFDIGAENNENEMPPNLLDDAMIRAVQQHRRKESQIASIQKDLSDFLGENVASNIATNLVNYMNPSKDETTYSSNMPVNRTYLTPHNSDDLGLGHRITDNIQNPVLNIDKMLLETVNKHQRKESRQEFLNAKLHQLFAETKTNTNTNTNTNKLTENQYKALQEYDKHVRGVSLIAENLVDFLCGGGGGSGSGSGENSSSSIQVVNHIISDLKNPNKTQHTSKLKSKSKSNLNLNLNIEHKSRSSTDLDLRLQHEQEHEHEHEHEQTESNNHLRKQLNLKTKENLELNQIIHQLESEKLLLLRDVQYIQDQKNKLALEANNTINQLRHYLVQYQQYIQLISSADSSYRK